MNCETCKAKIPTLATRLRRVNDALHTMGLTYWSHYVDTFEHVDRALTANGFDDMMNGVDEAGNGTSVHMMVGEGKWLHITWHRMDSGRYEVVAYVN